MPREGDAGYFLHKEQPVSPGTGRSGNGPAEFDIREGTAEIVPPRADREVPRFRIVALPARALLYNHTASRPAEHRQAVHRQQHPGIHGLRHRHRRVAARHISTALHTVRRRVLYHSQCAAAQNALFPGQGQEQNGTQRRLPCC